QREARGKALTSRRLREAQSTPRSPIDAQRRFAQRPSMMRQCIEEGVGCRIVPLARLAQEGARGRKEYKEVQGVVLEESMQQPATHHLGPQNRIHCRRVELHQQSVLQHSRRVHYASDRRPTLSSKLI